MADGSHRSVERYTLPRSAIPDTDLGEILSSDPLSRTLTGAAEGVPIALHRGANPRLSLRTMLRPGQLFMFKIGWLYAQDEQLTDAQKYFEAARIAGKFAVSALADQAGPFKDVIEKLGDRALESRPSDAPIETAVAYVDMLTKRGTVVMAGVNLVEVDHQVDPARLFARERHRLIVTHDRPSGGRATYSLKSSGEAVSLLVKRSLETRWWGELTYLLQKVKNDRLDTEAIAEQIKSGYLRRYGDDVGTHLSELFADYQNACDVAIDQQGFGLREQAAAMLAELAPMIPYYEAIPTLASALASLREVAGDPR
ncbi:hypothetical protein [Mycobacterium sp.]|uniref:hypothetical protein n=1 Tax=Mycobacterium sp. TaxID=1785 RepID=UPI003F969B69